MGRRRLGGIMGGLGDDFMEVRALGIYDSDSNGRSYCKLLEFCREYTKIFI